MKFYFDYFYYRITKMFIKYPSDRGIRAILLISLIQSLLLISAIEICLPLFLEKGEIKQLLNQFVWVIAFVVFGLFFLNFLKYRGRYVEFNQHWQNELQAKKIIKGLLVILSLIVPIVVYA